MVAGEHARVWAREKGGTSVVASRSRFSFIGARILRALPLALALLLTVLAAAQASAAPHAPRSVYAQGETTAKSWEFERFDSDIQVHEDGSFTVRETQVINFTGSFTFITRDIPTRSAGFDEGRTYGKVRVKDVEVFNLDGTPYDKEMWEADSYMGGELIRIEFQARDEQRGWIISYRMKGAMIYAEDYDRLYWNAVSSDRPVPIKSSRITVRLPDGTDMSAVESVEYYEDSYGGSHSSGRDGDALWWEAQNIYPYSTFTIDVSLPKGAVQKPWPYGASTMWLMLSLALAALLAAVLVMLSLWLWRGRDTYGGPMPGVTYGPPREVRPAVMAMLVHQEPKLDDVGATVVDLAVRGKLRIIDEAKQGRPGPSQFVFERKDPSEDGLLSYERVLMAGLFEKGDRVGEDDLRVGNRLASIMGGIRQEVKKGKFFNDDPEKTVSTYFRYALAIILLPPTVFFFLRFATDLGYVWLLLAGTVPAGIAVWVIAHAMPKRTALGSRIYWQAMGFREYLKTAEAGEPESMTLQTFQENLPYAMALGLAERWSALFAGVLTTPPDWYAGPGDFNTMNLNSSLSNMGPTIYFSGPPSSGSSGGSGFSGSSFSSGGFGGGSSGGGFGGGGSSAG